MMNFYRYARNFTILQLTRGGMLDRNSWQAQMVVNVCRFCASRVLRTLLYLPGLYQSLFISPCNTQQRQ